MGLLDPSDRLRNLLTRNRLVEQVPQVRRVWPGKQPDDDFLLDQWAS